MRDRIDPAELAPGGQHEVGRVVHGVVVSRSLKGIGLALEEVDVLGTIDSLFFRGSSQTVTTLAELPEVGTRLEATVQRRTGDGQLRLTVRPYYWRRLALQPLSDPALLALLDSIEPLPDEDDRAWDAPGTFDRAELLLAIAEEVGDRRLVEAIAPLYERVALGDVYESMPTIRHGPERAIERDWERLTAIMRPLARHERAGTRQWSVRELGLLRDPSGLPELIAALVDPEELVRYQACSSLTMVGGILALSQLSEVLDRLNRAASDDSSDLVRKAAREACDKLASTEATQARIEPRPLE